MKKKIDRIMKKRILSRYFINGKAQFLHNENSLLDQLMKEILAAHAVV